MYPQITIPNINYIFHINTHLSIPRCDRSDILSKVRLKIRNALFSKWKFYYIVHVYTLASGGVASGRNAFTLYYIAMLDVAFTNSYLTLAQIKLILL